MGQKRPLWSTILALATLDMLADLIIGLFLSTSPIMPNLGSLRHPHGLEEAWMAPADGHQLRALEPLLNPWDPSGWQLVEPEFPQGQLSLLGPMGM